MIWQVNTEVEYFPSSAVNLLIDQILYQAFGFVHGGHFKNKDRSVFQILCSDWITWLISIVPSYAKNPTRDLYLFNHVENSHSIRHILSGHVESSPRPTVHRVIEIEECVITLHHVAILCSEQDALHERRRDVAVEHYCKQIMEQTKDE